MLRAAQSYFDELISDERRDGAGAKKRGRVDLSLCVPALGVQ